MFTVLPTPILQQWGEMHTYKKNKRNIRSNHIFTTKSTFYDILYSMKIEVDTICNALPENDSCCLK